jgi:ABC-2 type transport system ATP-binding protein
MSDSMQHAIETNGLTKRFQAILAVDGIDLRLPLRAVTGFLGPNGAGKTTTMRMLLGLLPPTAGTISIFGRPMPAKRRQILSEVGALVETPGHYDHLTGRENLDVSRRLLCLPASEIDRVLGIVSLSTAAGKRVGGYSLGMRQRLGIARALLGRPRLLILDEPTNGLDPEGMIEVRQLIRSMPEAAGISVLVSSHLLAEVEQTVDHVALLWGGRLMAQAPLQELLRRAGGRIAIGVSSSEQAASLLRAKGLAFDISSPSEISVSSDGTTSASALNAMMVGAGIAVHRLVDEQPSLENAYRALTCGDKLAEAA